MTNWNKANDARLVVVGGQEEEEMLKPVRPCPCPCAVVVPAHPLVKLGSVYSGEDPNRWVHDLVCSHTIVSTGPNSHGNHYEED